MRKSDSNPQLDFDLRNGPRIVEKAAATVLPFVDAATLQVRRDAMRRFVANGIFASHPDARKEG